MSLPDEIAASLTEDQRRMVLNGRVDTGGEGSKRWESTFSLDDRLWERTTLHPEPKLTKLGLRVYYAIIAERATSPAQKDDDLNPPA